MSAIPSPTADTAFEKIHKALEDEDFELLSEATGDFIRSFEMRSEKDLDAQYYYANYLNQFARGYRKWQISYNYTEVRNYFYAAQRCLERADPVPHLANAFHSLTQMVNAYTRCENSFVNDDPLALVHYAQKAQEAEEEGLKNLRLILPKDPFALMLRAWFHRYFVKNLRLHRGLEACAQIYFSILQREPDDEQLSDQRFEIAYKALNKLGNTRSKAHSIELASELNAHIRFITQHRERTRRTSSNTWPTFLRLKEGTVTLCLSAGCDQKAARNMIMNSKNFKQYLMNECGLEVSNFRPAPLHDIFQTSFGSHFLQMLTFDLPSIKVTISDFLEREYKFDVRVKLTSLGSCTVYLSHEVEEPGLTVEEFRTLQSLICPHSGQVQIIDEESAHIASGFIEKSKFDSFDGLKRLLCSNGGSRENFTHGRQDALEELGDSAEEFGGWLTFQSDHLMYLREFSAWILDSVGQAFRKCATKVESKEEYERDRCWMVLQDIGWYSYVHARSLHQEDLLTKLDRTVDSFEAIEEHPDVHGFLIEPREARASFDDWRFMAFHWKEYPNLALIRSHPCDGFFASENRAFLYFPDDPKFLADQYEITVELMIWLGTALKFCEWLSQKLVRDVSDCLTTDGPGFDDENVKKHLDWVSRLRVQAGAVQALVSKTGISRYTDHGELMSRIVENMRFHRINESLDKRLTQFDQFYKKVEQETIRDTENLDRLTDSLIILIGTILAIPNIPQILSIGQPHPWKYRGWIIGFVAAVFILRNSKWLLRQISRILPT